MISCIRGIRADELQMPAGLPLIGRAGREYQHPAYPGAIKSPGSLLQPKNLKPYNLMADK